MRWDNVWHLICTCHHSVIEADNGAFDAHYANLLCTNSWISHEWKEKLFKAPRKKVSEEELMSQRQIHDNTQKQLRTLIMHGQAAIAILCECELLAHTSHQVTADEEHAAANKAAKEQKHAHQAHEQKRLEMADMEQSYCSKVLKLIDVLVTSFQENIKAERALNHQLTGLLSLCTQLVQAGLTAPVPPSVN